MIHIGEPLHLKPVSEMILCLRGEDLPKLKQGIATPVQFLFAYPSLQY